MNYRQKSKLYGKWAYIKYYGNIAIYAVCQHCGFTYPCYEEIEIFKTVPKKPYKYCPRCGLKMGLFNGEHVYKRNEDGDIIE